MTESSFFGGAGVMYPCRQLDEESNINHVNRTNAVIKAGFGHNPACRFGTAAETVSKPPTPLSLHVSATHLQAIR